MKKKNKIADISDSLFEKYYKEIFKILTGSGYNHYELSTYSKSGYECRHNLIYWTGGEYIGIGSSAHSHISGVRVWNYKYPQKYVEMISSEGSAEEGREPLSESQKLNESIMLGFHLDSGINIPELNDKFKINFSQTFKNKIDYLLQKKLVAFNGKNLKLTLKGKLLANSVAIEFMN